MIAFVIFFQYVGHSPFSKISIVVKFSREENQNGGWGTYKIVKGKCVILHR